MKKTSQYIILLMVSGIFLLPFAYLLLLSLAEKWAFPMLWPEGIGLHHWMGLLSGQEGLAKGFGLSLSLALLVAGLATGGGFWTSRLIAYSRYRERLMLLTYLPFVLSPVLYAAVLYIYFVRFDLNGSFQGVMLAQLIIAYPYAIILFSGFWNERLKAFESLAATLGGSPLQRLAKVLLPMARGILMVCFFQTFLISWFEYGLTSIIGVGKVQTLPLKVFEFITEANMFYAALASCLLIMPPAIFAMDQQTLCIQGSRLIVISNSMAMTNSIFPDNA